MKRGEVVFSPRFKFPDGGTSEKLLVVLNEATAKTPHLLLLATSQQGRKITNAGCHSKAGYYIIHPKTDWFEKITWIMFDRIYQFDFARELTEHFKDNLITKTTLTDNTIRAIIECLKKSDDITPYELSLLK